MKSPCRIVEFVVYAPVESIADKVIAEVPTKSMAEGAKRCNETIVPETNPLEGSPTSPNNSR